jgi:excisionase family DNA binding protein
MTGVKVKTVLTTTEAAQICQVSNQTINRCFDSGKLKGFRVPGSKARRIPLESLHRFMREHGIPIDGVEAAPPDEEREPIAEGDARYYAAQSFDPDPLGLAREC